MTDACTPPTGTKAGSWHWLEWKQVKGITPPDKPFRYPIRWRIEQYADALPEGLWEFDEDTNAYPEQAASKGWRYHSAVPEPEEVEALRKVVLRLWTECDASAICEMINVGIAGAETGPHGGAYLTPLGRRALGTEG